MSNDIDTADHDQSAETGAATPRRNANAAREAAAQRLATAQKISEAVERYHTAADRGDAAQAELAASMEDRQRSISDLRDCGLTITEISALTGLSTSRIQTLTRAAD